MHLIASITIALALAGTAQAETPATGATAASPGSAEAAVLKCHQEYAHRYANRVEAAPSEIAAGAFGACKQQMDAFEALAPELAKADEHVAIGLGDAKAVERKIVRRFRDDVRNATIDAVIRTRSP